jgi:hypothetical protein
MVYPMGRIGVLDLLSLCGYPPGARAKLVRHEDKRYPPEDLLRRGWLEAYQSFQARPVFDGLDYVVSFVGAGGTLARFVGVFRVLGRKPGPEGVLPGGCPYEEWRSPKHWYYTLERQPGYEELEHRLVIEWGTAALAWHQRASNKPIVQILPPGERVPLFKDYLGFTLSHPELRYVFAHADANSEWRARLEAVAGVYLLLATTTGHQYVGSAYGVDGIWGRWSAYADNGHGGNVQLKTLLASDAAYPDAFTYSILQILPRSTTRSEVLRWETHYKQKLGSSATGLNSN